VSPDFAEDLLSDLVTCDVSSYINSVFASSVPWVPEVFLACGGNFRCWPKADTAEDLTETGNRARKVSGTQGTSSGEWSTTSAMVGAGTTEHKPPFNRQLQLPEHTCRHPIWIRIRNIPLGLGYSLKWRRSDVWCFVLNLPFTLCRKRDSKSVYY